MELRQIEVFQRVAARESITRAAEELFLTQPAVSRSLAALERELGTRLFDRLPRRVALTPAGEVLLEHTKRIVESTKEAARAVADVRRGVAGRLALGASSTVATYVLPAMLAQFCADHPDVDLSVRIGGSAQIVDLVERNEVDLGIVTGLAATPDIAAIPLREFESMLVSSPRSPIADRLSEGLAAVAQEPFIAMHSGANLRQFVEDAYKASSVVPRIAMELDSVEAIKKMVEAGLGVSILPGLAVEREVEHGWLAAAPLDCLGVSRRRISVIHHKGKYVFAAMGALIALLGRDLTPRPTSLGGNGEAARQESRAPDTNPYDKLANGT